MWNSLPEYLGLEILREFEAIARWARADDPRPLPTLVAGELATGENLKDPYHATLLHTFLVTFGLLVAGNKSLMLTDATGRHGVMASAKSNAKVAADVRGEMRAYKEGKDTRRTSIHGFCR